uniref:Uncharacterized protein n=1 Tax=Arundo donax TaxID=35708 RepID=A0A0A8XXW1_ARUDO
MELYDNLADTSDFSYGNLMFTE